MLAPHAVDIAVTISSLITSLCFTFAEPFDDILLFVKWSCALVSRNTNKSLQPKEGRTTKRVNSRSLTKLLFCILQNSRKKEKKETACQLTPPFITSKKLSFHCHLSRWKVYHFQCCINLPFGTRRRTSPGSFPITVRHLLWQYLFFLGMCSILFVGLKFHCCFTVSCAPDGVVVRDCAIIIRRRGGGEKWVSQGEILHNTRSQKRQISSDPPLNLPKIMTNPPPSNHHLQIIIVNVPESFTCYILWRIRHQCLGQRVPRNCVR